MIFSPEILVFTIQVDTKLFLKELVNFGVTSDSSLKRINSLLYFFPHSQSSF